MRRDQKPNLNRVLEQFSEVVTRWSGTSVVFLVALAVVLAWLFSGPIFHFSDTWQLVINTGTTIVTFLMVFLIQRAQNKESRATALKLNELIASIEGASNRLIDVEDLSEKEIETIHRHFRRLVEMASADASLTKSHSVEEATERHLAKQLRADPRSRRGGRRASGRSRSHAAENGTKGP